MVSVVFSIVLSLVVGFVALVAAQGGDVAQAQAQLANAWQQAHRFLTTAFEGSVHTQAATLLTQAQQIASADTLYAGEHNGAYAPTLAVLVEGQYLRATPVLPGGDGQYALLAGKAEVRYAPVSPELCRAVTELAQRTSGAGAQTAPFSCQQGPAGELVFVLKG